MTATSKFAEFATELEINLDTPPSFAEMSYAEMVGNLELYYQQLISLLTAPGIIRYEQLALLRRRVISPDMYNPQHNRLQAQMRLATELLRLGRRTEALNLLKEIENRLLQWEKPNRSMCYLLWIALIRVGAGYTRQAFELAMEISANSDDSELDERLVRFFQRLHKQAVDHLAA